MTGQGCFLLNRLLLAYIFATLNVQHYSSVLVMIDKCYLLKDNFMYFCVCVCACVRERESLCAYACTRTRYFLIMPVYISLYTNL